MASIVQHTEVRIASSGTTFLITFTSGVTNGSTLFWGMADSGAPGDLISLSGIPGASWAKVVEKGGNAGAFLWIGTGSSGGGTTVLVTLNSAGTALNGSLVEVGGITSTGDGTATGHGSADPSLSGSITTTNNNDFLIGVISQAGDNIAAGQSIGGGYTQLGQQNSTTGVGPTGCYGYQIVSSTGSYQMTLGNANAQGWEGVQAAYKVGAQTYSVSTSMNVTSSLGDSDLSTYKSTISLSGSPLFASAQGSKYATTELLHASPVFATDDKEALKVSVTF